MKSIFAIINYYSIIFAIFDDKSFRVCNVRVIYTLRKNNTIFCAIIHFGSFK